MHEIALERPGPVENGLNRSELHPRLGLAEGVTFPRVPGIECAGVDDAAPAGSGGDASDLPVPVFRRQLEYIVHHGRDAAIQGV